DGDRNSFIASPGPATTSSGSRPHLAVTTPTSQPIARGSQIPIAPARRTVLPCRPAVSSIEAYQTPAPSAPYCQVTGRRLITLNESGHYAAYNRSMKPLRSSSSTTDGSARLVQPT